MGSIASFLSIFGAAAAGGGGGGSSDPCIHTFLGLKPWYYYLDLDGSTCQVQNFELLGSPGHPSSLLFVGLAVVDDLLRIAGIVAVIYVVYAGIKYIMSQGSPDETAKAQSTIINALAGLAIAVIAVALVSFVGHQLGTGGGSGGSAVSGQIDTNLLPHTEANSGTVATVLKIVFGVVGALALLFVVIGGIRYVMSNGDPQATTKARNTILYALVGLVIALLGQALVAFVLGRLT